MKKSVISILLAIFLIFVASCGSANSTARESEEDNSSSEDISDIGDSGYYESGDSENYTPGYNDPTDAESPYEPGANGDNYEEELENTDGEMYDPENPYDPEENPHQGDLIENEWVETATEDTSTFSIDVDTASYAQVRNYIMNYHQMPPKNIVRIEEMVNYFDYDYPQPEEGKPFSVTMEMADSPWNKDTKLVMFGLQGRMIDANERVANNLVFLIDVSGSMSSTNKLPLLKKSFKKLVEKLEEEDKISIVTYASGVKVVLDSVSGDKKSEINAAIDSLVASGATSGGDGLQKAYALAEKNYSSDANNRIILATDGDFNVGMTSDEELVAYIETERDKGVFLTIMGFGMGNYQDAKMEKLSNAGNGNYYYVDSEIEAEKIFTFDLMGTMFVIAKDVKLQVVFNPAKIAKYRLVGYENRVMNNQDFNDDTKDAGEIGAGHRVTAFYEVFITDKNEPAETESEPEEGESEPAAEPETEFGEDGFLVLKMRYKEPDEDISKYMDTVMTSANIKSEMSQNMGFASAVAEFGMLLRDSKFKADSSYDAVLDRAMANIGEDKFGYRGEFTEIVDIARSLAY